MPGTAACGSQFQISTNSGSAWSTIGNVMDINRTGPSVEMQDITGQDSTQCRTEVTPGLVSEGEVQITLNGVTTDAEQERIRGLVGVSSGGLYRIVSVDSTASSHQFTGHITNVGESWPLNGKYAMDVTYAISGVVTYST